MKFDKKKLVINKKETTHPFIPIVSSSIILRRNFADGQSIPLLILNTQDHPEIDKAIELHTGLDNGKITFTWGKTLDSKYIFLQVESISPVEIAYNILFQPDNDYALLEMIIKSHMLYIQSGKEGDRLSHNLNKPKLFMELNSTEFEKDIFSITQKAKLKRFKNYGVKQKDLKSVVKEFDEEWNSFTDKRFK